MGPCPALEPSPWCPPPWPGCQPPAFPPPHPTPDSRGAAALVTQPEKLQKEGKLGGAGLLGRPWLAGRVPPPRPWQGGCCGLPPPPSTAWPQTASGAASPLVATRERLARGHMWLPGSQPPTRAPPPRRAAREAGRGLGLAAGKAKNLLQM